MNLVRFAARSLFAGYFIADGIQAVSKPSETAPEAEAFTDKAVPLIQRILPSSYSSSVPEEAETWVRATGALKVVGGIMFATGIGRRLGAFFLAGASVLDIAVAWPSKDADKQDAKAGRAQALKHGALLGAAVLATKDLQGKPSLAWRAEQKSKQAGRQAAELGQKAGKVSRKAKKRAKKKAKKLANKVSR